MFADNPSVRLKAATESLKLKQELDRKAEEAEDGQLDPEQMQNSINILLWDTLLFSITF